MNHEIDDDDKPAWKVDSEIEPSDKRKEPIGRSCPPTPVINYRTSGKRC